MRRKQRIRDEVTGRAGGLSQDFSSFFIFSYTMRQNFIQGLGPCATPS